MVTTSITMLVWNSEAYLSAAIQSVLTQTMPEFELIIWDDGSLDNSYQIASDYARLDSRVKLEKTTHKGIASAFNAAVSQAGGKYIGQVDSDDLLVPTALQETVTLLESHPEIGFVYTNYIEIDEHGEERGEGIRCSISYSKQSLLQNFMTFHFRLFRRRLFEQIGGVDETLECAVDYDLCLRLSEITQFLHLPKSLYFYRNHSKNTTHSKRDKQDECARIAVTRAIMRREISDLSKIDLTAANVALYLKPKKLTFFWSLTKQIFMCNEVYYQSQETASTDPSHDLVHLIVAANGNLTWLPHKQREVACLAEYNAVLLETLFDRTCNMLIFNTVNYRNLWVVVLKHMQWFVEKHFAPFPISNEEAYQHFCCQVNPFVVSRLFPYYLAIKRYERSHSNYREAEYQLSFNSDDQPNIDNIGQIAQYSIYQHLEAVRVKQVLTTKN